ncbi:MAG: DUF2490 domain-containing protein [Prevotella sp.]|nr:DUF2490 domain-containing protein [Prevotella sp.]
MKTFRTFLAVLMTVVNLPLFAQGDDFGLWGELNIEKKINKRWTAELGAEYRSRNDMKTDDRYSAGIDVSYKVNDWLKASAGYWLLDDHRYKVNDSGKKYADYWGLRHRFNVSLTASQSFGKFTVSLRERWQYTYRPEKTVQRYKTKNDEEVDEHTYSGKGKNVWRNRMQVKYKLTNTFRPYVRAESYVGKGLEKMRYAAGTEIRINKQHSFDVKYLYQHLYDEEDNEGDRHIIGLGYTFKF